MSGVLRQHGRGRQRQQRELSAEVVVVSRVQRAVLPQLQEEGSAGDTFPRTLRQLCTPPPAYIPRQSRRLSRRASIRTTEVSDSQEEKACWGQQHAQLLLSLARSAEQAQGLSSLRLMRRKHRQRRQVRVRMCSRPERTDGVTLSPGSARAGLCVGAGGARFADSV